MLLDLANGPTSRSDLVTFIQKAFTSELNKALNGMDVSPSLIEASNGFRRAGGVALATLNLGDGRRFTPRSDYAPEDAVELTVLEDGGLRLFFSRFSDAPGRGISEEQMILDAAAVSCTRRFLALVLAASEHAGYFGNWALAFGATGLNGLHAVPSNSGFVFKNLARYDRDAYTATTTVTWAELNQIPGTITRRLVGALLRALAVESRYNTALSDPQAPATAT